MQSWTDGPGSKSTYYCAEAPSLVPNTQDPLWTVHNHLYIIPALKAYDALASWSTHTYAYTPHIDR